MRLTLTANAPVPRLSSAPSVILLVALNYHKKEQPHCQPQRVAVVCERVPLARNGIARRAHAKTGVPLSSDPRSLSRSLKQLPISHSISFDSRPASQPHPIAIAAMVTSASPHVAGDPGIGLPISDVMAAETQTSQTPAMARHAYLIISHPPIQPGTHTKTR